MIEGSVLLILGAGASAQFTFPSGERLVESICSNLSTETSPLISILNDLDFSNDLIKAFHSDLFHSNRTSVDAFLEHRPEFVQVGKASIALSLIPSENQDYLFGINARSNNWYRFLYNKMATDSFEGLSKNKLAIITFNYDRSIEHYLYTSIKSDFGKSEADCTQLMSQVPIVHVHGTLGALPWQLGEGRSYAPELSVGSVKCAMNGIKIISENVDNSPEFESAHTLIKNTGLIYFLGFGYHPTNMRRLNPDLLRTKAVAGTAYNMGDSTRAELMKRWPFLRMENNTRDIMNFMENIANLA